MGRVQVIQSEFGGKISGIKIANYASVKKGEVLLELDNTENLASENIVRAEISTLKEELERISVLTDIVSSIDLDAYPKTKMPELDVDAALRKTWLNSYNVRKDLLSADVGALFSKLEEYQARFENLRNTVAVNAANIHRIDAAMTIWVERKQMLEELYIKGAVSRSNLLNVQEKYLSLEADRNVAETELAAGRSSELALIAEIHSWLADTRSTLLNRKVDAELQLEEYTQELTISKRRVEAARIRSPVDGMVTELKTFSVGSVVRTGEELMRIVPITQPVEVEAVYSNREMGFLRTGQHSRIKLDAYPFERFGTLDGTVTEISADSVGTSTGALAYKVRVLPDARGIEVNGELLPLRPGMTVEVDVITNDRTLISYFFAPIVKAVTDSLGEL